jgi:hypothetical protein
MPCCGIIKKHVKNVSKTPLFETLRAIEESMGCEVWKDGSNGNFI